MIKNVVIAVLSATTVAAGLYAYLLNRETKHQIKAELLARDVILKDVRNAKSTQEQLKILGRYSDEVEFQKIALRNQ